MKYSDAMPLLMQAQGEFATSSDRETWEFYNVVSVPARAHPLLDLVCQTRGVRDLQGSRVLDLGSGVGTIGLFFRLDGGAGQVVGVDLDLEALRFLQRAVSVIPVDSVDGLYGNMSSPPVASAMFDVALIVDNLHYPGLDREATLRAAYRALRPGGVALVKVINGLFPGYALASMPSTRRLARILPIPARLKAYADERFREAPKSLRLIQMLRAAGFDEVRAIDPRSGRDAGLLRWVMPRVIAMGTRPATNNEEQG
jgi:SAM-dependent methyltransferase